MPIEFHCPKCSRSIRAPEDRGGRRGKCPYCKESVYIPRPLDEIEEIPIAPVDEEMEERERRLRQEATRYAASLDHEERATGGGGGEAGPADGSGAALPITDDEEVNVPEVVANYLRALRESDMGAADVAIRQLKSKSKEAREHVERLMMDEIPPEDLSDIPPPVYKGFLKKLLDEL